MQALLVLAVGKLDISCTAVALDDTQGVEFSKGVSVLKASKMPPVDLHLLTGTRLKPYKCAAMCPLSPKVSQIVPDDGDFPVKALFSDPLKHHRGLDFGIFFNKLYDKIPIGIKL